MSDERTPGNSFPGTGRNPFKSRGKDAALLKDGAILVGWIAGLLLIAGLCWFLTQSLRSRVLQRAVNLVLEQSGDSRRLGAVIEADFSGPGSWYDMTELFPGGAENSGGYFTEGTKAFIFTFVNGGIFFPCAALVSPEGKVEEFIPLGSRGERMLKQVSRAVLDVYARRIEEAGV